jgi:hypothetical protein
LKEFFKTFVAAGNGHIGHCNQGNNMYLFPGSVFPIKLFQAKLL